VWGVIFEIDPAEKGLLDLVEGLGHGYTSTEITVIDSNGTGHRSFLYMAQESHINPDLNPYSWYKRFVVDGARQHGLPADYVRQIECFESIEDPATLERETGR
jgi:hypothetical protein